MRLVERQVRALVLPDGKCSFEEWFNGLSDPIASANIAARLARVKAGNFGDYKATDEGVCELRIHYGRGYRVYFGQTQKVIVVLLWGGDKSSQRRDISYAQDLWRKYRDDPERFQRDFGA